MQMLGETSALKSASQVSSLVTDSAAIVERLRELQQHILRLGNVLHGAQPRDASDGGNKPEPEPTVRRNLDKATMLLNAIEADLAQISARV